MGNHEPDKVRSTTAATSGQLRLGVLHYHLRRSGVYTVIANTLRALIEYGPYKRLHIDLLASDTSGPTGMALVGQLERSANRQHEREVTIRPITLPDLGYNQQPATCRTDLFEQGRRLAQHLTQACQFEAGTSESPYVLHSHNANLGKNPCLTLALKLLADRWQQNDVRAWMLYQIHDFPHDNRPACWTALRDCSGQADLQLAAAMMYPTGPRVQWACVNSPDREKLLAAGLKQDRVTLVPNPVDVAIFSTRPLTQMSPGQLDKIGIAPIDFEADLTARIARFASEQGFVFEANRKILLAPVKALRRKNIIESVLLTEMLNRQEDLYQLLVTLRPDSAKDKAYCREVEAFVKRHRLPVVIGFGHDILRGGHQRVVVEGQVAAYSLVDMMHMSEAVLTTSVQEGFGYVFHEPWLAGKAVFGRNLPNVTADFTAAGLSLEHLYQHLLIPRRWLGPLWNDTEAAYQAKLEASYAAMGLTPPPPAETIATIKRHKCFSTTKPAETLEAMVDWADLSAETQLLLLQRIVKDKRLLCAVKPVAADTGKVVNWYVSNPHAIMRQNRASIARWYGLPGAAHSLARLIATASARLAEMQQSSAHAEGADVSNEAIFTQCLALNRYHLLT